MTFFPFYVTQKTVVRGEAWSMWFTLRSGILKVYRFVLLLVGGNAIGIKFKSNLGYNVGVTKHLRGKYLAGFIFLKQIHKYREVVFYSDPRAKRSSLLSIGTWDVSIGYDFHGTVRGRLQKMSWTHRSRFIQILRAILNKTVIRNYACQ